jgi:hypothetical protein
MKISRSSLRQKLSASRLRLLTGLAALLLTSFSVGNLAARSGGDDNGGGRGGDDGGAQTEAEFVGRVEALPASGLLGVWQVNGVVFSVDAATVIDQGSAAVAVGSLVEVKTTRLADGSLLARRIHAEDTRQAEDFGEAEFTGVVNALPNTAGFVGVWSVDNRSVVVSAATVILTEHGAVATGARVEVKGAVLSDGSVQATRIKTEDFGFVAEDHHFFGAIEALPAGGLIGVWQVNGLSVVVNNATRIETERGVLQVGAFVKIEGVQQPNASILASEIEVQNAPVASDRVRLIGRIDHLPGADDHIGNWLVNGVPVLVTPNSVFDDRGRKARGGREVEIHGHLTLSGSVVVDDVFIPRKAEVSGRQFIRFTGVVSSNQPATAAQPGVLIVEGKVINVGASAKIIGDPVIGATVTVKALPGAGGVYEAIQIKVRPGA